MKDEDDYWILNDDDTLTMKVSTPLPHEAFKFKGEHDICNRCFKRFAIDGEYCERCKEIVDYLEIETEEESE